MTLQEWFKAQGYGSLARCVRATGFSKEHISTVARGFRAASPFFANVILEYTCGAVCISAKPKPIAGCVVKNAKASTYRVQYGTKYLGSRPTREAAQALLDEYAKGVVA